MSMELYMKDCLVVSNMFEPSPLWKRIWLVFFVGWNRLHAPCDFTETLQKSDRESPSGWYIFTRWGVNVGAPKPRIIYYLPSKPKSFPIKTMVIWVPGVFIYIYIHLEPIFPTFCGYITLKRMMFFRFLSKPRVICPVPGIYTPADLAKMAREMACKCSCKWKRNDKLSQRIPYVWVFEPKYVFSEKGSQQGRKLLLQNHWAKCV